MLFKRRYFIILGIQVIYSISYPVLWLTLRLKNNFAETFNIFVITFQLSFYNGVMPQKGSDRLANSADLVYLSET